MYTNTCNEVRSNCLCNCRYNNSKKFVTFYIKSVFLLRFINVVTTYFHIYNTPNTFSNIAYATQIFIHFLFNFIHPFKFAPKRDNNRFHSHAKRKPMQKKNKTK